jgi:antitoxin ParD1/3/4
MSSMTSLNISLPQSLKDYVEDQVQQGGFSTPSEYLRGLVLEDQERKAEQRLEALLLEGIESGVPVEVGPEFWERKRQALIERHSPIGKSAK